MNSILTDKCTWAGHENPEKHQLEKKEGTCNLYQGDDATLGVLGYSNLLKVTNYDTNDGIAYSLRRQKRFFQLNKTLNETGERGEGWSLNAWLA